MDVVRHGRQDPHRQEARGHEVAGMNAIRIDDSRAEFSREPLIRPFGFKGGYLHELWQTEVKLRSDEHDGCGLGVQSVLWSDAGVFTSVSEDEGNRLMFAITERAMELAKGMSFTTPPELLKALLPRLLEYGRDLSGRGSLRPTFVLNALVPLDFAAWALYARANGFSDYDAMLPPEFRPAQSARHARCASIPLISYATGLDEVRRLVAAGHFFLKIKIGHPGSQDEMLDQDCARVSAIHKAVRDAETPWTDCGHPLYYFDANGRYATKSTFMRFVEHLEAIGAADRTAIVEEPFDELADIEVHDVPLRLAADESAHTAADAARRMDMGYRAMALKPIAKTLSVSLAVAAAAKRRGVPCFCADLTVSPRMVEWNKCVAARLDAFPGLKGMGLLETNGEQNYRNWDTMRTRLPFPSASWASERNGVFELDDEYYSLSGGIFA